MGIALTAVETFLANQGVTAAVIRRYSLLIIGDLLAGKTPAAIGQDVLNELRSNLAQ